MSGVKFETLFSLATNNFYSNSIGRLISTKNKIVMFSLSILTLLFILFYHAKPRFHVNDLLRNQIRESVFYFIKYQ